MRKVAVFDSMLRDGAQGEGISFSVLDKMKIVRELDGLGVDYIEAGNPGSNPKDLEFFEKVKDYQFEHAKLAAFGATRRKGIRAADDAQVASIMAAGTQVVTIFGKSWDFHVTEVIRTTLEENLEMIADTVQYFKAHGKEVVYDAEHFFDGYKANPEYALRTLKAAEAAGADCICLCETNGGALTSEVYQITKAVVDALQVPVGIHTHNDGGMAVANTVAAVQAGAAHVQGTLLGIGERCGNANLSTVIADLQLKCDVQCIPDDQMAKLTEAVRRVAEVSNLTLDNFMPYVGKSAFAHKGGMHADGVIKAPKAFEHVVPESVGNERRFPMSEVAGKGTVLKKLQALYPGLDKDSPQIKALADQVKELEHRGYQFEGADGSFEVLAKREFENFPKFFDIETFKVIEEQTERDGRLKASAMIKVFVDGVSEITAAEGDGPVNALDQALRKALEVFYPQISEVHLTDYKVRVLDSHMSTAAFVRVLIESSDGTDYWTTVGVSTDIIEASVIALADSIDYKLLKGN
ncbi:MAG: citramalate synthase [Actinomycetia bacterium]|nr:citramalate synthase [Actinomycetes bacterium]